MLIHPYNKSWVSDFQTIRLILEGTLQQLPITIEHIGSTAVPGLAAKPIIDIDIIFGNDAGFHEIKNRLETIGYHHNGNQGIVDREVFKRENPFAKHDLLNSIAHHLYVCPFHSIELRRHLQFRNYLRTHVNARNEYQQLKLQIAADANQDRKLYAALKEERAKLFIENILTKAGESD
jgi:GrpB-like predicted nucleotidyltransferase (UPF0157 family)